MAVQISTKDISEFDPESRVTVKKKQTIVTLKVDSAPFRVRDLIMLVNAVEESGMDPLAQIDIRHMDIMGGYTELIVSMETVLSQTREPRSRG